MTKQAQRAKRRDMEQEAERNFTFYTATDEDAADAFWAKVDQEWAERKEEETTKC